MTTALDIITQAMRKCGILAVNEAPTSEEANDALAALNEMLASWSNDSLMCYARVWESFTLSAGVGSYTIGAAQTFNTVRPIFVAGSYLRNVSTDTPVKVVTDEIYTQQIAEKSTQGIPELLSLDNAFPYGTVRLWPVPSSAYTLFMLNEKQLSSFTLNQTVSLPPGWKRALIYNLPDEIAGDYEQEVPASVQRIGLSSKQAIQRAIMKARTFDAYPQTANQGNVLTGWP